MIQLGMINSEESLAFTEILQEKYPINCSNCNLCCYYPYVKMQTNIGIEWFDEAKIFWNKKFILDVFKNVEEMGQYCPLAIPEGCLIYENRPLLCRNTFCITSSKQVKSC